MMTQALAVRHTSKHQEEAKNHNEDISKSVFLINESVDNGELLKLFEIDRSQRHFADVQIILALLIYPQMFKQLLEKIAKKQLRQVFKKSWYQGYQAQAWKDIL